MPMLIIILMCCVALVSSSRRKMLKIDPNHFKEEDLAPETNIYHEDK